MTKALRLKGVKWANSAAKCEPTLAPSLPRSLSPSLSICLSFSCSHCRVLKFCSCQSSIASSRGFQSRPSFATPATLTFCLSLSLFRSLLWGRPFLARVKQGIQSRRIFPFNIYTISHICTTGICCWFTKPAYHTIFQPVFPMQFYAQSIRLWTGNKNNRLRWPDNIIPCDKLKLTLITFVL